MTNEPEKKTAKPETTTGAEGKRDVKKPTETLTDAIVGTLTSIFKIRDLRGATEALVEAQKLKDGGKPSEARDLASQVFKRIKNIGINEEDLPEREVVLAMVEHGEFASLAKLVAEAKKEIDSKGQHGKWKQTLDRVGFVEEELKKLEREKGKVGRDVKKAGSLARKSAENIGILAGNLGETVAELDQEVTENVGNLVEQVGGELKKGEKTRFEKEWNQTLLEAKLSGRSEVSLSDVVVVREKLKDLWQEKMGDGGAVVEQIKKGVKEDEKLTKRKLGLVQKTARQFVENKAYSIAAATRTKELANVIESVEGKLKLGLSFERICQELSPNELKTIQSWLWNAGKKPGEPGYDKIISEINEHVLVDPEGQRVFFRLLKNVQLGHEEGQYRAAEAEAATRGLHVENLQGRTMRGEPTIRDEMGRPVFGMDPGMTGFNPEGARFLEEMGQAEWVDDMIKATTREEMMAAQEKSRALYRAEMMNVNFESLMDDDAVPNDFKKMLDVESFSKGQVARLKEKFRNDPEARRKFQALWLQEMLYAQRLIAYEGVFQGAHYDARITRYNTLMSIMDISTELKGFAKFQGQMFQMVDIQQNSYLTEEALDGLVKPWLSQGPDFRLEHLLKEHRENIYVLDKKGVRRNVGSISVYDVVHKLKMRVENADERAAMEMPDGVSRHYGTMMERHSEADKRTRNRKIVFFSLMKDLGVDFAGVDQSQQDMVYNMYQSYLDEGINYLAVKKQLHQAVGNASFEKDKYALCQALPEMLYKADPFMVMDYFRIYGVGGSAKDFFVFGDSGMRDQVTMSPNDYAQHLLELGSNDLGAPGILEAFFGNRQDEVTKGHAKWFAETMDKAIFHYGYHKHGREVTMSTRIGNSKERRSGTRRPDAEIIDILRRNNPPKGFVEAIDWGTKDNPGVFAKIVVNPRIVDQLVGTTLKPEEKWKVFVDNFGEEYLNMQSAGAKRVEHMSKYGMTQHFAWYKNYLGAQLAPVNNAKAIEMFAPLAAVNSAIAPYVGQNYLEAQHWLNEALGRRELGGKSTKRVERNEKGQLQFDTSYGRMGEGDSEWPGLDDEDIWNDRPFTDPIQRKSVLAASGVAGFSDELAMKNLAEDMYRAGLLTENVYRHWYKEDFMKSFFWQDKKGILANLWHIVNLDAPFEYMGNVWFGLPGHLLKHAWWEPTEKQLHNIWKYFSGGGH